MSAHLRPSDSGIKLLLKAKRSLPVQPAVLPSAEHHFPFVQSKIKTPHMQKRNNSRDTRGHCSLAQSVVPRITTMGRREVLLKLKLETKRLWGAGASAQHHRPFPSIALSPAATCGPLPSRKPQHSPESGLLQPPIGFTPA